MKSILRHSTSLILYAGLIVSICLSVWSLLRTDIYRQQTELILGQASEIQWRASQSKEKVARIIGYLNVAVRSGEKPPRLLLEIQLLSFNLKSLVHLDYAATFITPQNIAGLHKAIKAVDTVVLPVAAIGKHYEQALGPMLVIDEYLAGLASAAVDHSQALSATSHIATDAARNRLVFFGALSALILSIISIHQYSRINRKKDQHIRSFSLLFAHMTRTRITALRLFLGYLDGKSHPPPEMADAALRTIVELESINEGLMTIGHARAELQPAPLATLLEDIVRNCKYDLRIDADGEAGAVRVPASQFHLLIDELVRNSINAVAARTDPAISIRAYVRRRFLRGAQLVLIVSDNGTGMSPSVLAKAREPFFSTKAGVHVGLGLTNCVELIKTMAGTLDIISAPGAGTSVRITYSI